MGPRKVGTNSHHGCSQCKRRSVKVGLLLLYGLHCLSPTKQCDELRPVCTNCISRATDCQYATSGSFAWKCLSEVSASSSFPRTTRQSPNSAEADVHWMSQIGSPQQSLQVTGIEQYDEQQSLLLSHWRTSTYQAITGHSSVEWIWQHLVPEESLSHPCLLNGVLALSAMHLVTKTGDEPRRTALIKAAERYQGRAISMLAYVIGNLNPSNCNATFCLSNILVICAWGFPLIAHVTQATPWKRYIRFFSWSVRWCI